MDLYFNFFKANPALFSFSAAVIGLMIGSFLNVVIYRLPIMIARRAGEIKKEGVFTLSQPASACPRCEHKIRWWENVPVLSYLVLWGKCAGCGVGISCRYPLIELLTGSLFLTIAMVWGVTLTACLMMLATALLVALLFIDWDTRYLPNVLNYPFIAIALLFMVTTDVIDSHSALWGATVGALPLYLLAVGMMYWRNTEVIGLGDIKLLLGFGVMLGVEGVLNTLLLASVLFVVGSLCNFTGEKENGRLSAFGPHIIIAGWMQMVWGSSIYRLGLFDLPI